MEQITASLNTLVAMAISIFGAFLHLIIMILNFFLVFVNTILAALHLQ